MPFGVTNAPSVFMDLMNRGFHMYLDLFVIVCIDDILIYSTNHQEHKEHLKTVLNVVREKQLFAKLKKCEFWMDKVSLLGHVISKDGVAVDPSKVEVVVKWEWPTNVHEIERLLLKVRRRFFQSF
jgi:hypothetical protein